jgi:hypothetical protein
MKKHIYFIIAIVLALALITTLCVKAGSESGNKKETTTISEAYIPSETTTLLETSTTTEVETTKEATTIETTEREESTTKETTTNVSTTKAAENHPATTKPITTTKTEVSNSGSYAEATQIWNYMKNLGWSDAVCAGIMGNMMAEVGGQTLDLSRWSYYSNGSYYGVCQWSRQFYPSVIGRDIEGQCDFLRDTIRKEINTYGSNYASGMNYEKFLQLDDPQDVALCFAKAYERCGSGSYGVRQSNAVKAYQYFVG